MILPFSLVITTSNTPQSPTSLSQNSILAALVASSNSLAAYGINVPPYGFRISGLRFEASAACSVVFGLYNTVNFITLWESQQSNTAHKQVQANFSKPDGYLSVPVGNAFVPAFKLSTAPGSSVTITGELKIASIDTIAPVNTVTAPSGAPVVLSASVASDGVTLTWVMDENSSLSSGAGITLTDGSNTYTATYDSGSGSESLVFTLSGTVLAGDSITDSYNQSTGNIVSTIGSHPLASFTNAPVTNNSTQGATAPTVVTATIASNGTTLTWAMSQASTIVSGAGITVNDGSSHYTATYVSGSGTTSLVFTVSGTILSGDTVTDSYNSGTGNITGTVGGLPLATFTNASVTNNSTQGGGSPGSFFAKTYFAPTYFSKGYFGPGAAAPPSTGSFFAKTYFAPTYFSKGYFGPEASSPPPPSGTLPGVLNTVILT